MKTTKRFRLVLTFFAGTVFLCIIGLTFFISLAVDRFLHFPPYISTPYNILISLPLFIMGIVLWAWSVGKFVQAKGTPVPINPPLKLITDGPYVYSRNPMMTGVFLIFTGIGIFLQSITITFLLTPLSIFIVFLTIKYIEEPELEKRFGEDYLEYKERTPRFLLRGKQTHSKTT